MKVATVFIILCFVATSISADVYGFEVTTSQEWWNDNFYLKFNSPSGKTFYIDFTDGTIHREKNAESFPSSPPVPPKMMGSETESELNEGKDIPFISFVSLDLKIYDIYFEHDGVPRLEESRFVYLYKYVLVRHRLDSFVGPNNKVYRVIYNGDDGSVHNITEKSSETLDHFRIITFGPYEKWEHSYDFSENGEVVVDHTISPVSVSANRSILLPQLEPKTFIDENYSTTFVKFNSPSGVKYHITTLLNIVPIRCDDLEKAYITFTEPNGRTYDILIDKEDQHPFLMEKSVNENYFDKHRLYSFVAPNRILYRIDHKNESGKEVPFLVSNSSESMDLQITLSQPDRFHNTLVKYIFSDNGLELADRVDDIDWTPLNESPAIPVEEVTANHTMASLPFLTFYTPSGNNYHIFTNQKNATIAVERGANSSESLYISYFQTNGRKTNIYLVPGDHPYLEEEANSVGLENHFSFFFLSFGTPDQKKYSIKSSLSDDDEWKQYIELPFQVKEPIDLTPVSGLFLKIRNENGWEYLYRFTWDGSKLVEASLSPPKHYIGNKVLTSLIGK